MNINEAELEHMIRAASEKPEWMDFNIDCGTMLRILSELRKLRVTENAFKACGL